MSPFFATFWMANFSRQFLVLTFYQILQYLTLLDIHYLTFWHLLTPGSFLAHSSSAHIKVFFSYVLITDVGIYYGFICNLIFPRHPIFLGDFMAIEIPWFLLPPESWFLSSGFDMCYPMLAGYLFLDVSKRLQTKHVKTEHILFLHNLAPHLFPYR